MRCSRQSRRPLIRNHTAIPTRALSAVGRRIRLTDSRPHAFGGVWNECRLSASVRSRAPERRSEPHLDWCTFDGLERLCPRMCPQDHRERVDFLSISMKADSQKPVACGTFKTRSCKCHPHVYLPSAVRSSSGRRRRFAKPTRVRSAPRESRRISRFPA